MPGVLKHRSSYDGFASFTAKAAALIFATVPAATIGFRVLFVIKGRRAGAVEEEEEEEESNMSRARVANQSGAGSLLVSTRGWSGYGSNTL